MTELRERDAMVCRSCGREERASEGYPCARCGTFLCLMCSIQGVLYCRPCAAALGMTPGVTPGAPPGAAPAPGERRP